MESMAEFREYALRCVEEERAADRAAAQQVRSELAARLRRRGGASLVYSVRLDPSEIAALTRRAAEMGIKPTVLARNLIRVGLSRPREPDPWD
jgi:hypothetical protein